jgi:hypothetical protein
MKFLNSIMILFVISSLLLISSSHAQIWTGINEIKVDFNTKLIMPNIVNSDCSVAERSDEVDCYPKTTLRLIFKGKSYSYQRLIAPWEGSFFIYFVKLGATSYARDLNGDGLNEIAIYPAVCGNSPKSLAYIYTVKGNQLLPYGTGTYFWETGAPVIDIKRNPNRDP